MKKLAVGVGAAVVIVLALSNVRNNPGSAVSAGDHAASPPSVTAQAIAGAAPQAEAKDAPQAGTARLDPRTRERLEKFSQLMRRALMSGEERAAYEAMLSSREVLDEIRSVLTAGPLPEDKLKDTSSQEAELLSRLSAVEITHGQVARVRAVNFIKESYELNAANIDQDYVKSILFAPDLQAEADQSVKQSMIAAKIELYKFFSNNIKGLDRYLEENIENTYQRKIYEFLVKKPEKG